MLRGPMGRRSAMVACCMLIWAGCSESSGPGTLVDTLPIDTGTTLTDTQTPPSDTAPSDVPAPPEDIDTASGDTADTQGPVVVTGLQTVPGAGMLVEIDPGKSQLLAIKVQLAYSDGTSLDVTDEALWTTSHADIVGLGDDGTPFATGKSEGQVTLVALHGGLHASLTITVKFKGDSPFIIKEDGLTIDDVIAFESLATNENGEGPTWIYPQALTVFPNGMYPPLLQWEGAKLGVFRLTFTNEAGVTVTVYTKQTQYQPSRDLWLNLGSVSKGKLTMSLTGAAGINDGPAIVGESRDVITAHATLAGSVYYWEVKTGSILRLKSDSAVPSAVQVFSDNAQTGQCRGCHTLSKDGSKLAYSFNAKGGGELGMAWATQPEPEILAPGSGVIAETMTYGPSGNKMVIADLERMWLADVTPGIFGGAFNLGNLVTVAESGGTQRAQTPEWSPDGSALAYTLSNEGNGLAKNDETGSAVVLRFWDEDLGTFVTPTTLIPENTLPGLPFHDYPTWTPDSKWIVARSSEKWATSSKTTGATGLTMIQVSDGAYMPLSIAAPVGDRHYGRPHFSPFMEGGYYWLVFYSDLPYGVVNKGTEKQLWVTAIDLDAAPGSDPSHPPFWLPGQDPTTVNLSGYWAQPYCQATGEICTEGTDCCLGLECVIPDGETEGVCEDSGCDLPGEYCDWKSSNCCPGYVCKQSLTGAFSCQPDWSADDND